MKQKALIFKLLVLVLTVLVVAGCSRGAEKPQTKKPLPPAKIKKAPPKERKKQTSATATVTIKDFSFQPQNLEVPANTTVVWVNKDAAAHIVHANNDAFKSPTLNTGDSFKFKVGTTSIDYHCHLHPNMTGKITVKP